MLPDRPLVSLGSTRVNILTVNLDFEHDTINLGHYLGQTSTQIRKESEHLDDFFTRLCLVYAL